MQVPVLYFIIFLPCCSAASRARKNCHWLTLRSAWSPCKKLVRLWLGATAKGSTVCALGQTISPVLTLSTRRAACSVYVSASTSCTKHATSQLCPASLQPGAASFASQNALSSAASCGQSPAKQFFLVRMKAAAACARSGNLSSYTWKEGSGRNRFNDFTSLEA